MNVSTSTLKKECSRAVHKLRHAQLAEESENPRITVGIRNPDMSRSNLVQILNDVDGRQIHPKDSLMLQILDLISLAHLAG